MMFQSRFLHHYSNRTLKWLLFSTALFIRLPYFFRDYIDRDESTFILMGQSIADGHLPYVHLWDLKPPLLFYIFGGIEYVFPHSFAAIRFCGVVIVFGSALLLACMAKSNGIKNGFLIALLYIMLSSEFGSLQGVMSEHFAVFFMLLGIVVFQKKKNLFYLVAGMAFGCALLCKLSYAYAVAAFVVCYLGYNRNSPFRHLLASCVLLTSGLLLPFFIMAAPFFVTGRTALFINSVFLAPLEYGTAQQYSFEQKLGATWWMVAVSLALSYLAIKKSQQQNRLSVFLLVSLLLGTVYTFLSSGIINGHYLVQAYPFLLLLLFGLLFQKELSLGLAPIIFLVVLLSVESILECYRLAGSYYANSTFYYRPAFQVVDELKKHHLNEEKIFFADYHIGYWLLRQEPLTKSTTHPTNLARPYLFKYFGNNNTSLEELKYLMENIKPSVVVNSSGQLGFFAADGEENNYFRKMIKENFIPVSGNSRKKIYIWKRRN